MLRLLAALVFSGAAGLVYQVAWTRRLASVTSATVMAQAVVAAVFMAGLGLGSMLASRAAARKSRPLRVYAALEAIAAALAAVSIPVIVATERLHRFAIDLGATSSLALAFQTAAISTYLILPTTMLGATLPFMLEHVERRNTGAPKGVAAGVLYGVNTFGAGLGAVLSGYVTIDRLGLTATTRVGACLAGLAAVIALSVRGGPGPAITGPDFSGAGRADGPEPQIERWVLTTALAGGIVGLGAEVLWTRMLSLVLLNTVYAFTQVLLAILFGIALGGWLAGACAAKLRQSADREAGAKTIAGLLQALTAVSMLCIPLLVVGLAALPIRESIAAGSSFSAAFVVVGALMIPTALNAALLPLLVTSARTRCQSRSFGELYSFNTIGSVAGSAGVGLVFLPLVGAHATLVGLAALSLLLSIALLAGAGSLRRFAGVVALAALTSSILALSYRLPVSVYAANFSDELRLLAFKEAATSDVLVTEDSAGRRRLWINSAWVATAGGDTGFGHRLFGHLPALLHKGPKRSLGIALGTGQTFAAVLHHGVDEIECAELNEGVIELSRTWFAQANEGLFDRPQVRIHHDDGRSFLRSTRKSYDLIVLEPLQAWTAGTSSLYALEFYQEAKRALAPGGVMLQWIPLYGQGPEETRAMVGTAREVFPWASLWLSGREGMLILHNDREPIEPFALEDRIQDRGIEQVMARQAVWSAEDLLCRLLLGPKGVKAWTNGAALITDDHPFLEFRAARRPDEDETARRLADSLGPHVTEDDLSEYVKSASTAADAEYAVPICRATLVELTRLTLEAWAERAGVLEAALVKAPGSRFLRRYYRSLMESWLRELERIGADRREHENVQARLTAHDPAPSE